MNDPKEIGELLKEARKKKNLTIEKIYKAARIQPNIVEAMEEGRADELLDSVYVLLFLKKYASFLDLDSERLAVAYKTFYARKEEPAPPLRSSPLEISIDFRRWAIPAIYGVSALIFIFLILILGVRMRRPPEEKTVGHEKAETIFPIPRGKRIELSLRSTDDVWMNVKKDKKGVFEGTLRKGETKKWTAENEIELWVGRAEALFFTVNGKPLGKIGKGKIKSIRVTKEGLKAAKEWLIKAKD